MINVIVYSSIRKQYCSSNVQYLYIISPQMLWNHAYHLLKFKDRFKRCVERTIVHYYCRIV